MIALVIFILSSSSLFLIFRGMGNHRDPLQVLMFNYFFCMIFSLADVLLSGSHRFFFNGFSVWMPFAACLGVLYLLNFSLTEKTVRFSGAAVSSVAAKLSLVLPFCYTLILQQQIPDGFSMAALLICLPAIILISGKSQSPASENQSSATWILPGAVFIGSGLTDIFTQWLNQALVPQADAAGMVLLVFTAAFFSALGLMLFRQFKTGKSIDFSTVLPGFLLGLPNFISYKSILASLNAFHHQGNLVFPVANLGVIVFTTLVSTFWFREKLSRQNMTGIFLAILALILFFQKG